MVFQAVVVCLHQIQGVVLGRIVDLAMPFVDRFDIAEDQQPFQPGLDPSVERLGGVVLAAAGVADVDQRSMSMRVWSQASAPSRGPSSAPGAVPALFRRPAPGLCRDIPFPAGTLSVNSTCPLSCRCRVVCPSTAASTTAVRLASSMDFMASGTAW